MQLPLDSDRGEAKALSLEDWNLLFPAYAATDENDLSIQHADFEFTYQDVIWTELQPVTRAGTSAVIDSYTDVAVAQGISGAGDLALAWMRQGLPPGAAGLLSHASTIWQFQDDARANTLRELAGAIRRDSELALRWNERVHGANQ